LRCSPTTARSSWRTPLDGLWEGDRESGTREPGPAVLDARHRIDPAGRVAPRSVQASALYPPVAVATAMASSAGDPDPDAPIRSRDRELRCSMYSSTLCPGRRSAPSSILR
jgi:hypothetical protein